VNEKLLRNGKRDDRGVRVGEGDFDRLASGGGGGISRELDLGG
jgi:hypothetical protein